jgi:predicted nucleic acid-binding protein
MIAIADTGALYALYDADDANHAAVLAAIKKHKPALIIPVVILAELDYLLREFLGIEAELDFLSAASSGHYALEVFTEADLTRSQELLKTYRDLDLGLVDAAIAATAERLKVKNILTVDQKHFHAIRPKHGTFVLLPGDFGRSCR